MPTHSIELLPTDIPGPHRPVAVNVRNLPPDAHVAAHRHAWAQLACSFSGAIRLRAGDTTWIVPPQSAVWIPPEIDHEVAMLGRVEMRTVYVAAAAAPRSLDTCEVIEVSALMRELIAGLGSGDAAGKAGEVRNRLLADLLLVEIRRAPARSFSVPMPSDRRLRALCEALLADPAASLTLQEWAPRVGASARTLARLFAGDLGLSFGQWRQRARLAHAAALIGRGEPLGTIAAGLGYDSPSAFTVMFKRAFGMTPRDFLRADRG